MNPRQLAQLTDRARRKNPETTQELFKGQGVGGVRTLALNDGTQWLYGDCPCNSMQFMHLPLLKRTPTAPHTVSSS